MGEGQVRGTGDSHPAMDAGGGETRKTWGVQDEDGKGIPVLFVYRCMGTVHLYVLYIRWCIDGVRSRQWKRRVCVEPHYEFITMYKQQRTAKSSLCIFLRALLEFRSAALALARLQSCQSS